jgi:hypothetical protein
LGLPKGRRKGSDRGKHLVRKDRLVRMMDNDGYVIILDIYGLKIVERTKLRVIGAKKYAIARIESGIGNARRTKSEQEKGCADEHPRKA